MSQINLVSESGIVEPYTLQASKNFVIEKGIVLPRITYSAVHVVANPLANVDPWINAAVDWDATINYRR
jgi:hypothetical protein